MKKSDRVKPSFVSQHCCELMQDQETAQEAKLHWSLGGPSVWPTGCFHTGFIHGTTIRRIRAVTDINMLAHGFLNGLTEARRERQNGAGGAERGGLEVCPGRT